ncbi:MAG: rane protein involved in colicin uptake [Verrucomicrobiaceae bacterium]|nr:rane protein involved in colicin uptake [Verrucomicrobiaceae bacterium]
MRVRCCLAFFVLLSPASHGGQVDYAKDIKPLLKARCYTCHGALKQKAGLRLDTVKAMRKGGDEGDILKADHALLLERVTTIDKDDRMPPEGEGALLNPDEVAKLKAWVAGGAPGPADEMPEPDPRSHWAYQSPKSSGQTVDAMLAKHLEDKHLKPQPEAAPEVWLRRVYLDLTGLPPSPEDIEAFLKDTSAESREQVVDHLLGTPQYGERWARHFMDIWRYCDWYGLGAQLRYSQKHIWHWRDWIVEAVNADKGYDRMIIEQLAADELAPEDRDNLRATGFLARSYFLFNRTTWLDDTIEHTSRAFLGLTMQCVKCHTHKYDPIEHADYYRMRAVFEPLHVRLDPWPGDTDFEKNGLPRVYDLHNDQVTYRHVRGDEKNEDKSKPMTPGVPEVLAFAKFQPLPVKLPNTSSQPELLPFVLKDQLNAAEAQLAHTKTLPNPAAIKAAELRLTMTRAVFAADQLKGDKALAKAAAAACTNHALAKAEAELAALEKITAPSDKASKAEHEKKLKAARDAMAAAQKKAALPGETYASLPASLKAQEGPEDAANASVQSYPETSTGRRLALARWIADERNTLTARVLVNQVWTRHFGASFVPDVSDFGRRAPVPACQDILDTLSVGFMQHGWSLKWLHKQMVLSELYRRSSSNAGVDAPTLAADPDNTLYWRMNPRRMESQVVRDSLLQLAGRLDLTLGGPSLDPSVAETSPRRSLYFIQNADTEHRFLATFDNSNVLECYRRNESVVPQQALALTNSKLSNDCAEVLAKKLGALDDAAFLQRAFLAILSRAPTTAELIASREGYAALKHNRSLFLQALINHNDFVTLR